MMMSMMIKNYRMPELLEQRKQTSIILLYADIKENRLRSSFSSRTFLSLFKYSSIFFSHLWQC